MGVSTAAAPSGVVTFSFTDVEGPTRRRGEAMTTAEMVAYASDQIDQARAELSAVSKDET